MRWVFLFLTVFFLSGINAAAETLNSPPLQGGVGGGVSKTAAPVEAGLRFVKAEGKSVLGEDTTISLAKKLARENAFRNAIEEGAGVDLQSSSLVYNGELVSDLINSMTKGRIVKYTILDEGCDSEKGMLYCYSRLEAHVNPVIATGPKGINILRASVKRPDKDASSGIFQDNDEIQVKAVASQNAYFSVFSVDQYGNIAKLYPNEYAGGGPAGKEIIFPDNALRTRGLKLRVMVPKELSRAFETVVVIASKEDVNILSGEIKDLTLSDLMTELSTMEASTWAEKTVGYEVRK